MNILIVGGFGMRADDGEMYWTLGPQLEAAGHKVRLKECEQTGGAAKVTQADFLWADATCAYSYGMASQDDLSRHRTDPLKLLIIIAGVPDIWIPGQWYGLVWKMPDFVLKARNFQVDAIPASETIREVGIPWVNFGDPIPPAAKHVNINANSLVTQYINPIDKHTNIQNHPQLLAAVLALLLAEGL